MLILPRSGAGLTEYSHYVTMNRRRKVKMIFGRIEYDSDSGMFPKGHPRGAGRGLGGGRVSWRDLSRRQADDPQRGAPNPPLRGRLRLGLQIGARRRMTNGGWETHPPSLFLF